MTTPDLTKKVLGFRAFNVVDGELAAFGFGTNIRWMPGVNRARCYAASKGATPTEHLSPSPNCHCGIYGLHKPEVNWKQGGVLNRSVVAGAITAHGTIEVHHRGFRAEYAQVAILAVDPCIGPKAMKAMEELGKLYEVRLVDVFDLEAEAQEFGEVIPKSLIPEHSTSMARDYLTSLTNQPIMTYLPPPSFSPGFGPGTYLPSPGSLPKEIDFYEKEVLRQQKILEEAIGMSPKAKGKKGKEGR